MNHYRYYIRECENNVLKCNLNSILKCEMNGHVQCPVVGNFTVKSMVCGTNECQCEQRVQQAESCGYPFSKPCSSTLTSHQYI